MQIKIKKLHADAKLPIYSTEDAAGADLFTTEEVIIKPGETAFIKTGLSFEFPKGYFGLMTPRSSLCLKKHLDLPNSVGILDADYRGDLIVSLRNLGTEDVLIEKNEKIAQIIFMKYEKGEFAEVEELENTSRGDGGFGSTGKF